MKKRLTGYAVLIAVVLTYFFNCSFTVSPYRLEEAEILPTTIQQTRGETAPLPSRYSAYDEGLLSPATSQGSTSVCWAFSHNEVLTANVAKKTGVVYDFSEQTMKFETAEATNSKWGYRRGVNDGGNEIMSTAYLARSGSVLEKDEPFNEGTVRTADPDTLTRYGYLKNTQMYSYGVYDIRESAGYSETELADMRLNKQTAIQKVKELVYTQGAVGTGIYYEYAQTRLYENADSTSYYYNGPSASPNHSVTIVGWDDSYSRDNFRQTPEADGAFIIKNSWGNYHASGTSDYFYMSYYDKHVTSQFFASEYEIENKLFDNIYQYDGYGWVFNGYATNEKSMLCISRFKAADANEAVNAVSTYIAEGGTTVDVYINTLGDVENESAYIKVTTERFDAPGYYLIEFDSVPLINKEYFVAINFTSSNNTAFFPLQINTPSVCPNAENTPDTCYVGTDFSNITPLEKISSYRSHEAMHCIKSFTVDAQLSKKAFTDVKSKKWYADEVAFCTSYGIFSGNPDNTFQPESPMTRAMFVKVLANLYSNITGNKIPSYSTPFTDLEAGRWYVSSVGWAYQNNIVNGDTDTTFNPNAPVTREQICALLTRFCKYMDIDFAQLNKQVNFTDSAKIYNYAKPSVADCQRAGIVSGMPDGSFAPKSSATRAEVATMLTRLYKLYIY